MEFSLRAREWVLFSCLRSPSKILLEKRELNEVGELATRILGMYVTFSGAAAWWCGQKKSNIVPAAIGLAAVNILELAAKIVLQPPSVQWTLHAVSAASLAVGIMFLSDAKKGE
mmetsp:Transcript_23404/g.39475  ORF Transcript_23404/g.39475 Transcript_23404/m.39475 type:complete len:114 (-) Transcript_23404:326-667(-)